MKNKKVWWIIGGISTLVVGYFVYDLLKLNKSQQKAVSGTDKTIDVELNDINVQANTEPQPSSDNFPIGLGSYGARVHVLQMALNNLGASITVDGKFGEQTYDAVYNVSFGFGNLNFLCGFPKTCKLSNSNFTDIITKAEDNGFKTSEAWTDAEKYWKL